jgi:hypothetical protein
MGDIMITLEQHIANNEDEEARAEAISDLSVKIASILKRGSSYQPSAVLDTSKHYWHMDDFISDVCIDNSWMVSMLNGDSLSMQEDMQEKFEKFCDDAAADSIDKEWELQNEQ